MQNDYHRPVLLAASVEGLNIRPDGIYVDATFGGGGHSRAILEKLGPDGRLVAFDQDDDAVDNLPNDSRLIFVNHNFKFLRNFLRYHKIEKIDGLLADLGVSSHHFDSAERGFSFRYDAPLDMRMNQQAQLTAANVLNQYPEITLRQIMYQYGELNEAQKIAYQIIKTRSDKPFELTGDLVSALERMIPRAAEHKFLAKVFQALRIEVNHEMESLSELLQQSAEWMVPGGRLSVITYHSLEDRLVKNFIKAGNFDGKIERDFYGNYKAPYKAVNKSIIVPDEQELEDNNRSRSAKLRIAERTDEA
jgi:16S rRNA (cytosine1402-N4)-methyltransferase